MPCVRGFFGIPSYTLCPSLIVIGPLGIKCKTKYFWYSYKVKKMRFFTIFPWSRVLLAKWHLVIRFLARYGQILFLTYFDQHTSKSGTPDILNLLTSSYSSFISVSSVSSFSSLSSLISVSLLSSLRSVSSVRSVGSVWLAI